MLVPVVGASTGSEQQGLADSAARPIVRQVPDGCSVTDLFWVFHEDRGECRVSSATAAIGLAAALLWDLRDSISIGTEAITVTQGSRPADPLEAEILWYLADEERYRHRTTAWLEFIAHRDIYGRTAGRLIDEGKAVARGLVRKRYEPTSIGLIWPAVRMMNRHHDARRVDDRDLILLALVLACGLQNQIFYDGTAHAVAYVERHIQAASPALQALYTCTKAAIGKAVEVHR